MLVRAGGVDNTIIFVTADWIWLSSGTTICFSKLVPDTFLTTNCAILVPFEEDEKNSKIWFLDHNYHESMWAMFKKVNARERVVGWYSTGPKIKQNDLEINEVMRRYCPDPVLVVVDVQLQEVGIPTKAYVSVQEVQDEISARRFQHLPSVIEALEAEEVGVEHLLRDVKDSNISTLATQINDKASGLKSLIARLKEMHTYLANVAEGKLPLNHSILNLIQQMFNLLPNLNQDHIIRSFNVQTNDNMLTIYLSSLIRSVIALHNLINNKLEYRRLEDIEAEEDKAKATGAADADKKAKEEAKDKKDAPAKNA